MAGAKTYCILAFLSLTLKLSIGGELKPIHGEIYPPSMNGVIGCETDDSEAEIKWYRGDVQVVNNDKHSIERYPENSTLQFTYAGRDEIGAYVCKVDDDNQAVAMLRSAPYVYYKKSVNLNSGNTLELECRGFGIPEPTVTWFRAEVPLIEDGKRITFVNTTSMINGLLVIKDLTVDDYSNYVCNANNTYGSYNSTTLVRVKSPYRGLWPIGLIAAQLLALALIIFCFERRKKKSE